MEYFIDGGKALKGEVALSGAKNVALKLLIAALLTEGRSKLDNIPRIRDVISLIDIINSLGGTAKFVDKNTVLVENTLKKKRIPLEAALRTRVSFMLLAPLLFTFGEAEVPNPGGCRLGARPVDRLVNAAASYGAEIKYNSSDGYYYAKLNKQRGGRVDFPKKTHTGTELALMLASRIAEPTVINNPSCEPEIDDLISFLQMSGVNIRKQRNKLLVTGRERLKSVEKFIQFDRNEAVSFIILSSLFAGNIVVKNVNLKYIASFLTSFRQAGFKYEWSKEGGLFRVIVPDKIKPVNIQTSPHPGFMTDWQPMWALLMTQAAGISSIHETVFEDRFGYVEELRKFGARIEFYNPKVKNPSKIYQFNWKKSLNNKQAIKINGPSKLHNAVSRMLDIRAGACIIMAALVSHGKSIIEGAEQIERGYEDLPDKLKKLGASIQIIR